MTPPEVLWAVLMFLLFIGGKELWEILPWLAKCLVCKAVTLAPAIYQDRLREEWLAELPHVPGKLSPLLWAVGTFWTALGLRCGNRLRSQIDGNLVRLLDLTIALPAFLVVAPLIAVVVCLLKVTVEGGMGYVECVGRGGRVFRYYRFFVPSSTPLDGQPLKRKLLGLVKSFSALPALLNLIRGDMNYVGPPPVGVKESFQFDPQCAEWMEAYRRVGPGLIGGCPYVEKKFGSYLYRSVAISIRVLWEVASPPSK